MKATLDFRDDLIDKEVVEKLSKEVSSYIIEQVKHNMDKSIEERAKEYSKGQWDELTAKKAYISGAKEQKAIDEEVRLKKCDDMTEAEYKRETAFVDWYYKNGKGTPTFSDAIEWARKKIIDDAELAKVKSDRGEYYDELTKLRRHKIELIEWLNEEASRCRECAKTGYDAYEIGSFEGKYTQAEETIKKIKAMEE